MGRGVGGERCGWGEVWVGRGVGGERCGWGEVWVGRGMGGGEMWVERGVGGGEVWVERDVVGTFAAIFLVWSVVVLLGGGGAFLDTLVMYRDCTVRANGRIMVER